MYVSVTQISAFVSPSTRRAWIEISVNVNAAYLLVSPSTRRAWIEIKLSLNAAVDSPVALHPEGVDRNRSTRTSRCSKSVSPSTRRAWIEIRHPRAYLQQPASPSTRRAWIEICTTGFV